MSGSDRLDEEKLMVLIYPTEPTQRQSTMLRDGLVLLTLVGLAWVATRVYSLVVQVRAVTEAVQQAGSAVQQGLGDAADALAQTPVVGEALSGALTTAAGASGGGVVALAASGQDAITRLAWGLSLLTFGIPAGILLVLYIPVRLAQVRRLRGSQLVFRDDLDPDRRRLMAQRAALSLPVDHLVRYTRDPIGDLIHGEYDALVAALLEDAGLAGSETVG